MPANSSASYSKTDGSWVDYFPRYPKLETKLGLEYWEIAVSYSSAVQAALAQLSSATTLQEVTDIANSLSAAATSPNGVLYSGMVGLQGSNVVAQSFASATGASIINNTDRAQFLALLDPNGASAYNDVLTTIIQNTEGLTASAAITQAQIVLFGSVPGVEPIVTNVTASLWGQASAAFVSSLTGDVTVRVSRI